MAPIRTTQGQAKVAQVKKSQRLDIFNQDAFVSLGYLLSQYSSFVRTSNSPLVARLVSIAFPNANEGCRMSFFYFIRSPYTDFATLTISTTDASGSGHNPKTFTGSSNAKWTKGSYSLKSALAFNVTIESTITAKESTVSIDDIYFQGNCPGKKSSKKSSLIDIVFFLRSSKVGVKWRWRRWRRRKEW